MPLTLRAGELDLWRSPVADVSVVECFSGELVSSGSLGDAGVGAVASGGVGSLEDFGDGVADAGGQAVRGKTRLPSDVAADDAQGADER